MRTSSVVAASAALVAGANAWGNVTYTTEVVTAYTTFCPSSTELVHGTKTYTVTEATTLVITDCPCTVTKPVYTKPVVYCSSCPVTTPAAVVTTPVYSSVVVSSIPVVSVPVPIGTAPAGSVSVPVSVPVGTGVPSVPSQGPLSPPIFYNSTVAVPPAGTGTAAPPAGSASSTGQLPVFTGAANKAFAVSGAGLLSVLGLFAYIL